MRKRQTLREYERSLGKTGWEPCEQAKAEFQRPADAAYMPGAWGRWTRTNTAMADELARLSESVGWDYAGEYLVCRTKFHGGGIISRHMSPIEAIKSGKHHVIHECECGCCDVITPQHYDTLSADPWSARDLAK